MDKKNLKYLSNFNKNIKSKLIVSNLREWNIENKILIWNKMDQAINNRPKDPTLCGRAHCTKPRI